MLSENLVIDVQSVSKKYKLYNQIAATSLLQSFFNLFKTNSSGEDHDFWALHGISFAVEKGDILGIIGPNGSGKSTLLKILSGIITPNEGEIAYRGKIKSILDIGTGFHPDLSGRENVYLNGNLLGMSRSETSAKFDDIAAFSNIGEFIDMPVKTYSAGMFLRLAFSVSFILKADILLIDEVLSVGDMAFRQQCTQKIRELSKEGVTMLVISHDINEVMELCNKCLLLNEGKVVAFGKTKQVVDVYTEQIVAKTLKLDSGTFTPIIHEKFILQDISVYASHKSIGAPICMEDEINIDFRVHKLTSDKTLEIIMFITNSFNVQILADSVVFRKDYQLMDMPSGKYTISCRIPANFFNYGHYTISVFMAENKQKIDDWNSIYKFAIIPNEWEKNSEWIAMNTGLRPYLSWNVSNISS